MPINRTRQRTRRSIIIQQIGTSETKSKQTNKKKKDGKHKEQTQQATGRQSAENSLEANFTTKQDDRAASPKSNTTSRYNI
ncbi:hypothetical protein KY289_027108 [Solanum tuberosum]|nr:hypothetical protein KY289_027108 [Solanum tuberosum]